MKKNDLAERIEEYFDRLWPICRSITGPGFRESLEILSEIVPFNKLIFHTGEKVLDWTVPKEWIPRDSFLISPDGKKHAEFKNNNLHLVGYSIPFTGKMQLSELRKNIYTLPDQPDAIPYVTSYYKAQWGFCMSHNEYENLPDGEYYVFIDTELTDGELVIGEAEIPGESEKEIIFSTYLCHPSMANNELSGPLLLSFLYEKINKIQNPRYTYKFFISPETIGAIALLSKYGLQFKERLVAGYQITCIGDSGDYTFKRSRRGNSLADKAAERILKEKNTGKIIDFNPAIGSDERQFCSPGFNLPVGSLMRTMYTKYPEYHTSLDNKNILNFNGMTESVDTYFEIIQTIENNYFYINTAPYGEPQLGPRGLFRAISDKMREEDELAMWWLLNYTDGEHDLLDIAEISGHKVKTLSRVAMKLEDANLLVKKNRL